MESLNYQLRKITKIRGQFPNDTAAIKLLWLAICNIEDKRAGECRKSRKTNKETVGNHLVGGASTSGWKQALQHLAITYPERLDVYLN